MHEEEGSSEVLSLPLSYLAAPTVEVQFNSLRATPCCSWYGLPPTNQKAGSSNLTGRASFSFPRRSSQTWWSQPVPLSGSERETGCAAKCCAHKHRCR
jgi:hypothetical protein